jgi:hypothetical protein
VASVYWAAVRGLVRRDRPDRLPDVELAQSVAVDLDHLAAYDRVCGLRLSDTLPATYPHVLAFPLTLALLTRPDFPLPLPGLVHLANRIEVVGPVRAGDRFDFRVRAKGLAAHERGAHRRHARLARALDIPSAAA